MAAAAPFRVHGTLVPPLGPPPLFEILAHQKPLSAVPFFYQNGAITAALERVLPSSSHCPTMAELASCTIYIKGIATTATEADVRDACSQYGNITEVAIPEGKDFCFVEFAEEAQAQVCQKASQTGGFALLDQRKCKSPPPARRFASQHVRFCGALATEHMDRSS